MGPSRSSVDTDDNRPRHTSEIPKFPVLGAVAEQVLCQRWRDHHDISAAHHLTGGYLSLVARIAMGYRGYGLASEELIGEAYVGLMHAICQFDPDRGVSFVTYATWWVHATILERILRDRSPVKMGTTVSREKLFVSLRSMHGHLREFHDFTRRHGNDKGLRNCRAQL
jgi:RNA polymerase sigma-32 factor